jgi:hypothetical protein
MDYEVMPTDSGAYSQSAVFGCTIVLNIGVYLDEIDNCEHNG